MRKQLSALIGVLILTVPLSLTAYAFNGDLSINSSEISFSPESFLEGRTIRIYATVKNAGAKDLLGVVRYYDNNSQIGGDQAISVFKGNTDGVFIDWTPLSFGSHKVAVKIFPFYPELDDPSNNWIVREVYVEQDTDHDGLPNTTDPDDDNDGVPDETDAFPLNSKEQYDTDGDGVGDNADLDDDNDGVPDDKDALPLDPNESIDTDKDGIGDNADTDDDSDGLTDLEELNLGTDPLKADTDGDSYNDKIDAFPLDPNEWLDTDQDKIGNNVDTDDDNDGLADSSDSYPQNVAPVPEITDKILLMGTSEHTFDGSPSYDKDGQIVSYIWDVNGKTYKGKSFNYNFQKTGEYAVKLTVKDSNGESKTKEFSVNILNITLYKQLLITLLIILLALVIYFKYITPAKNPEKDKNIK